MPAAGGQLRGPGNDAQRMADDLPPYPPPGKSV
jgi:hypothetical protein